MYLYLPSCNFTAANPVLSKRVQQYINEKEDARSVKCCRVSQNMINPEEDTVITNCFTCSAITNEVTPDADQISIWEYLLADLDFVWPDYHGERITLQDCWRSRNKPKVLDAVRECMHRMNIEIVETEDNRENCQYDGVWRFHPVVERNMKIAPEYFTDIQEHYLDLKDPATWDREMEIWCQQYTTDKVAVYCNACLDGLKRGKVNGVHLMELVFRDLMNEEKEERA